MLPCPSIVQALTLLAKARKQQHAVVVAAPLVHPDNLPALTVDFDLWKGLHAPKQAADARIARMTLR